MNYSAWRRMVARQQEKYDFAGQFGAAKICGVVRRKAYTFINTPELLTDAERELFATPLAKYLIKELFK